VSGGERLICLAGVSGSGKDAAGAYLAERHAFQRVAFADPLKDVMAEIFGLTREQLWSDERNIPHPRLGRAPRELYQEFGRACRKIDPDVWIRKFRERLHGLLGTGRSVVCTDLRTLAELRSVKEMGGTAWLIERPGAGAPGRMALDATETELARVPRDVFDRLIRNDGTSLEHLHRSLDNALATPA